MLKLDDFLPYRLSVLSNQVSHGIAETYAEPHQLSVTEWRILAILGLKDGLSATEVAERSAMDKVSISRAIKRLMAAGRVRRQIDDQDGRARTLWLTDQGRAVYEAIAPAALDYEKKLKAVLSKQEQVLLNDLIDRLLAHTQTVGSDS